MARFHGVIGFSIVTEDSFGESVEEIIERPYYGDIVHRKQKWINSNVNDNIGVTSEISVISNEFMNNHLSNIRYIECWGAKWKVEALDPQYPRIILTLGGVWNGPNGTYSPPEIP